MEITNLGLKLLILLLPGVITTIIIRYLVTHKEFTSFYFIIYSGLFGLSSFLTMELFVMLLSTCNIINFKTLNIWNFFFNDSFDFIIVRNELFASYVTSSLLGFLYVFFLKFEIHQKLIKKLKLSKRHSDDDAWEFFFSREDAGLITALNHRTGLAYHGFQFANSETGLKRELIMRDVTIYRIKNWKYLYEVEYVYIELPEFEFSIELQK